MEQETVSTINIFYKQKEFKKILYRKVVENVI